ncbi:alpha/beta hydrolase fold domain-containing protein [Luteibacter aegosomatissinici]|uniref:alpha/beta hydrolase fold domain-containing protein n=1 Tax=Luteibacter aegosomatissinici TaxID=2911539 RepID=UPI001FFB5385|nr:alpha/beta hydrolase fold domain-containing protein [Luteibacter aegosomatissinici]UPG94461.1 alpha/beta hydrolase [Luteibacter aegosomatissinici]
MSTIVPCPIEQFPLSPDDAAALPALHAMFARFWSSETAATSPRVAYDAFIALTAPREGVSMHPSLDPALPGWVCVPEHAVAGRALLYIHGGAYTLGTAPAYRGFASQIAARTQYTTYVLEYPLAPEAALPAAINTASAALDRLASIYEGVGLVGDSAGGGLTLATLAGNDKASAAVVFSPWTDLTFSGESMRERGSRELLLQEASLRASARAYIGEANPRDPRASPLLAIPERLPPLLVQVGSEEILYDDALGYAARARAAGHAVMLQAWAGMHHVFPLNVAELEAARGALDEAGRFLRQYLGG